MNALTTRKGLLVFWHPRGSGMASIQSLSSSSQLLKLKWTSLNTYLWHLRHVYDLSVFKCTVTELLTSLMSFSSSMLGRSTSTSSPITPLAAWHSWSPASPASADCLAHNMMTMMTQQKNLIEQFEQLKLQLQFLNHELQKDAVKWLSPLTRGLLCITAQETLSSMGKAISLHLLVCTGLNPLVSCTI